MSVSWIEKLLISLTFFEKFRFGTHRKENAIIDRKKLISRIEGHGSLVITIGWKG